MKNILTKLLLIFFCLGIKAQTYNYAEALQKSLYFYDAEKCGLGIDGGLLTWRGNCHTTDAVMPLNAEMTNMSEAFIAENIAILDPDGNGSVDVSGGYHDAGDHVQFGLPQTYSSSTLEWALYEFRDAFVQIGEYEHMMELLRWASDYYLKCTFRDQTGEVVAFCYQVGEGNIDHNLWAPPELVNTDEYPRPAYFATSEQPASDQCAGAAASLALSFLNNQNEDPDYAEECLETAEALYNFAVENRGLGYDGGFYNSSYDEDELAWAAVWLYIATGNTVYLDDITAIDANGMYTGWLGSIINSTQDQWQNIWVHSWDTKWGGIFTKLAPITDDPFHWYIFRWNLEYWSGVAHEDPNDGNYLATTPAGFSYLNSWGSARYNAAAQFQGMVYKKYADERFDAWMTEQMNYIMGDNPLGISYIVGYSDNHVMHPHHRAAHGSPNNSMFNPPEHKHTLWGALVGGPGLEDEHVDETNDFIYNEVAIDYNAGLVGALAGHVTYFGTGQEPQSPFPPADPELVEYTIEAKMHEENAERSQLSIRVRNESAFPPRRDVDIRALYYFNISELLEFGQTIDDVTFTVYYDENDVNGDPVSVTGPNAHDAANGIYYMEFIWPESGFYGTREYQFGLLAGQDANFNAHWDPSNDYSREGIGDDYAETIYIPMYADGELVVGNLPGDPDNQPPLVIITADPRSGESPLTVNFDGSASTDPDGDDLSFSWDFGDGTRDTGALVAHTYVNEGSYSATLTVSDGILTSSETFIILVGTGPENNPPVAILSASPLSGIVPLEVNFDATGSTDPEGDELSYTLNFDDGNSAFEPVSLNTFTTPGTYTVSLVVSDGEFEDETTVVVEAIDQGTGPCEDPAPVSLPFVQNGAGTYCFVTDGNINIINSWNLNVLEVNGLDITNSWTNNPPPRINGQYYIYYESNVAWAHLEIDGTDDGPQEPVRAIISATPVNGVAPLEVNLSGLGSTGEGNLTYQWEFGDGTTSELPETNKIYSVAGSYLVSLTVTDETGISDMAEIAIEVEDEAPSPPVAIISADPVSGTAPLAVTLDASASTDPQDLPLTYAWDLGDGTSATGQLVQHTYSVPGTYQVSVSVNNGSLSDQGTLEITVTNDECENNTPPIAVASVTQPVMAVPVTITLDGSSSTDPDGQVLSYSWLIGGSYLSGNIVSYLVTEAGTYEVQLTVTDNCGASDSDTNTVTAEEAPDPGLCEDPVAIQIPFTQDGAGDFCWITTTEIAYINSWNLEELTINGVDYTNTWSNSMPAAENGSWTIHYQASVPWAHFEAPQAKSAQAGEATTLKGTIEIYPNPFNTSFKVSFSPGSVDRIEVVDMTGKKIKNIRVDEGASVLVLGEDLQPGIYMISITHNSGIQTSVVRKF